MQHFNFEKKERCWRLDAQTRVGQWHLVCSQGPWMLFVKCSIITTYNKY